jgi:transcriptional regulator with XRE-family HTH domain
MALISFGDRLLEVRKSKSISQDALAKSVGAHGAVIGRYERNEVKPSIEMATKLASSLGISLDYLVGSTDSKIDNTILKKVVQIQKLNKEDKGHLFALMDAFLLKCSIQNNLAS